MYFNAPAGQAKLKPIQIDPAKKGRGLNYYCMPLFSHLCALILLLGLGIAPVAAAAPNGTELLRNAMEDSKNEIERDHKIRMALPELRKDAIAGDAKAQYNLARLYEMGIPSGPSRDRVTFPARAYAWYVAAARQGHAQAEKRLTASQSITTDDTIAPAPLSEADRAATGQGLSYQLKIAAFRNPANAATLVATLMEEGIIAAARARTDPESGAWHVVESAPVFSRREAEALAASLKRNFGVDPQIAEFATEGSPGQ